MLDCLRNKEASEQASDAEDELELIDDRDPQLWSRELRHCAGIVSWAVARPNASAMLQSQIEISSHALIIGIYDGFDGSRASQFLLDNLVDQFVSTAIDRKEMDQRTIRDTFTKVDSEFLNSIEDEAITDPKLAVVGSSCLMFLIWEGNMRLATVGDSYGLIGRKFSSESEQLNFPHYLNNVLLRQDFLNDNPNYQPEEILVKRDRDGDGDWCVKGGTKLYRAMGVGYLKRSTIVAPAEFQEKYEFSGPITKNVLSAIPHIADRSLQGQGIDHDRFVILASQGFWKCMIPDEAAEIVRSRKRTGIARRLVQEAQWKTKGEEASEICVAVVFLDDKLIGKQATDLQCISHRGFGETAVSRISELQQLST